MTPTSRGGSDPVTVGAALRSTAGPLMRQLRKVAALTACLEELPRELEGLAAPYDIRLAAPQGSIGGAASQGGSSAAMSQGGAGAVAQGGAGAVAEVSTMYIYVAGATVAAVLEQRKAQLVAAVNARLPYPVVEDLRCEQASAQKIGRQLNILAAAPD